MSNSPNDFQRKAQEAVRNAGPKLSQFMQGRNGVDALAIASLITAMVANIISWIPHLGLFGYVSVILFVYGFWRMYSRNIVKRAEENLSFINATDKPRHWINLNYQKAKLGKTTAFFTCPNCGTNYTVPKGKGQVRVTCPRCKMQHLHTT